MGRHRKADFSPTEAADLNAVPAQIPVHPQPAKERPLPEANPEAPSRFDEPPAELAKLLEAAMITRGFDPTKTSRKEFFEMLMWEWTLSGTGKLVELGARILGRGYIGDKSDSDKTTEPLFIEDYQEGVKKMLGKESTAGKKGKK